MRAQIQPVIVIEDVAADKRFEKTVAEKEGTKQVPVQRQNSNLQNKCNQNLCFSTFQQVINKNNSAQLNEIAKMVAEKKTKQQTVHARRRSSVAQDKPKNLENTIDKINKVQLKNPPVSNNREANETELGQNKNKCLRKRSPPESLRNDNAAVTSRRILDRTLIDGIEFQVLGSPIKKRRFSANDAARLPTPAGIKATPNRVLRSSSTRTCAQCGAGEDASSPRRIVGENGKLYCSYDCKNGGCKRAMSTDLQDVNKAEGPIANKMCIQSRPRNQVPEHKIADWTLDEVSKFVELETSSQNLAWRFYEEEIDGRALLLITKEDMIRHLNAKVGHALKVEDSVCELRK